MKTCHSIKKDYDIEEFVQEVDRDLIEVLKSLQVQKHNDPRKNISFFKTKSGIV